MRKSILTAVMVAIPLCGLLFVGSLHAQEITRTAKAGPVAVTLKVLPAESFRGPHSKMKWDGGAKPDLLTDTPKPNHHLVVFLARDKRPVERADVTILYRETGKNAGNWKLLPVVRMHVAGKSLATTHFGNNVHLAPGNYEVIVIVNHNPPADFHFKLAM